MLPLVSVIIPTANRPQFLPRAVDSALAGMGAEEVEVIVVPNGPDESWRESLRPYQNSHSVRVINIKEANANIARNAGLAEARGIFIRFLDDDDYLFPEFAVKQYELLKSTDVAVVSGSVKLVDDKDRCFRVWHQPDMDDFCAAVLGPMRNCLPTAHVYRRSCLEDVKWNPETFVRQDVEWMLDLCSSKELNWRKTHDEVGAWQHHPRQRISLKTHINEICKLTVPMVLRTCNTLDMENRLNDSRRHAAAQGLWGLIHRAFFFDPFYWNQVASKAFQIYPSARPMNAVYHLPIIRKINPLLIQWLLLPKRWTSYQVRRLAGRFIEV